MRRSTALAPLLTLAASLVSCGGGMTDVNLFDATRRADDARALQRLEDRLRRSPPPPGVDVVVAVSGQADRLIGLPLLEGTRWAFEHPLDARPVIAGQVVVGSGGGEVFALDASTGEQLWARPTGGLPMRGAGDDGSVTVITFSQATGTGSTLLAVLRDGASVRQIETDKSLGAPAVVGGLAFVPWNESSASVIDLSSGNERARLAFPERTSRAWTAGGALFFGGDGFFRFDQRIADAPKNRATHVRVPTEKLLELADAVPPGGERLPPSASFEDRTRLYATPTAQGEPMGLVGDRFYGTYVRLVMGFEARSGALAWVRPHDGGDVVGAAAGLGGLTFCDARGVVRTLSRLTGDVVHERDLGEPIVGCVITTERFAPEAKPTRVVPLFDQIVLAVTRRDPELVPAQRWLLSELAALSDDAATRALTEVVNDPRTSPELVADARAALARRAPRQERPSRQ